jgi:hypothetical protein
VADVSRRADARQVDPVAVAAPGDPVEIEDASTPTVAAVIARLEVTAGEDDLYYREAELDALFTIFDMGVAEAVRDGGTNCPEAVRRRIDRDTVHRAHDLVAAGHPKQAARELAALAASRSDASDRGMSPMHR